MLVRWDLTVFSLISSRRAISLFGIPSSSRENTSRSRGETPSSGSGALFASSNDRAARGSSGEPPCRRRADAAHDLVGGRVLQQVADRAGVERARDPPAIGERGEHEHGRRRERRR